MNDSENKPFSPNGWLNNKPFIVFLWASLPILTIIGFTLALSSKTSENIQTPEGSIFNLSISQITSSIVIFIIPAIVISYFYKRDIYSFLGLKKAPNKSLVFWSILLMLSSNVFIDYLTEFNKHIPLPQHLELLFTNLQQTTLLAQESFMSFNNFFEFLLILFVVAVLPAVSEEIYFRGLLAGVLFDMKIGAIHAIIISSLLFACIHFQFYYFLPLFFMGALLAFIYYKTKNLWLSIIAHFVNNGMIVILTALNKIGFTNINIDELSLPWFLSLLLVLCFGLSMYQFLNTSKTLTSK